MNRRRLAASIGLALMLSGMSIACGTTDPASQERLPPIRTTVASTTTTTTTIPPGQRFYTIKSGDTLAAIAASFEVTVESIVALNDLTDPNDIQADQTIEIPSNVVVVTELPDSAITTTP